MGKCGALSQRPPHKDDAAVHRIRLETGADVAEHCRVIWGQSENGRSFCLAGGMGMQQVFSREESALLIGFWTLGLSTELR